MKKARLFIRFLDRKGEKMKYKRIIMLSTVVLLWIPLGHAGEQEIELLFPVYAVASDTKGQAGFSNRIILKKPEEGKSVEYVKTAMSEFVKKFEQTGYRVDQIELWVEGTAESGKLTSLVVSLEGKGGCKIILKPQVEK
jgi:hypothetical protein